VALEDALPVLRHPDLAQDLRDHAVGECRRRAEQPGLVAKRGDPGLAAGQRMVRGGHRDHLVVEEVGGRDRGAQAGRERADRRVDRAGEQQRLEPARVVAAELDVEVVRPVGEQLDQPRGGVLGEQRRRCHPQQPPAAAGLPHLEDRAVLQAEHLGGPAREPQPARRERQPRRRAQEQLVAEFLAQLADVQRDGGLGHLEVGGRLFHRTETYHRGEGAQLRRRQPSRSP